MLVLGVILILVAAGATLVAVTGASSQASTFDFGVFSVEIDTVGVFLSGAATVLLLVLGLGLVQAGIRRANRRRREKKELTRRAEELEARQSSSTADKTPAETPTATRTETRADATEDTRTDVPSEPGSSPEDTGSHRRSPQSDDDAPGPVRPAN